MMKKILIGSLMSLALVSGFAVNAKEGKSRMGNNPMKLFKKLDLSEAQETQIKAIFKREKSNKEEKIQAHKDSKAKKDAIVQAKVFDETAAKALIEEQTSKMKARMLMKMKKFNQAWNILTAEQQTKAKEKMAKFHKKMEKRMNKKDKKDKKGKKDKKN